MTRRRWSPRDLPLLAKLLVPFLLLILVIAAGGLYIVVDDLSSNAQASLNGELLRLSLDARSRIHDRELYLLESANFAANLEGIAGAVRSRDTHRAGTLVRSVAALKTDLELVTILSSDGTALTGFVRDAPGRPAREHTDVGWAGQPVVLEALAGRAKAAALVELEGASMLAIAAPVCSTGTVPCGAIGVAVVGMRASTLMSEASGNVRRDDVRRPGVAVYGASGGLLASSGSAIARLSGQTVESDELVRRSHDVDGDEIAVLYAPLEVQGRQAGTLAVALPAEPAFAAARTAALRLALLFVAAIIGVVGVGYLVSRWLLAQVTPLVETSRELGQGDLGARVPVVGHDELGELALVLNRMADQLQASHQTLERRVEQRTAEVQQLLRERNELFAGISHELRTPIAVILSEARMLIEPGYRGTKQEASEAAGTIIASGEQLLGRVNEILQLARAESGQLEISLTDVRVSEVFGDIRGTARTLASQNDVVLEIASAQRLPTIRADRSRLADVLVNLIENAVKYTPPGGTVSVAAGRRNGSVQMSVTDTGVGIPASAGDLIFEPFYQVQDTRPPRGGQSSGLGLAVARRVVEAQGGTISYTSRPGKGSRFVVELRASR